MNPLGRGIGNRPGGRTYDEIIALGEVVLHSFSLGGATVLRAAPESGVAAVVEEFAYAQLPLI